MATDIAFALGVLALAGRRVPTELKIFLLGIAVADDIGAIIVIAVFYASGVTLGWLAAAAGLLGLIAVAQRLAIRHLGVYLVLAVAAWLALLQSGVHATLAGVAVGLLTPAHPFHAPVPVAHAVAARVRRTAGDHETRLSDDVEHDETVLWEATQIAREGVSPLFRLERSLHAWSAFVILPVFALANAGVRLSGDGLSGDGASLVALGAGAGLLLGKPVGIVLATLVATRTGLATLPRGVTTRHVIGVGVLGGVGFTVALFVAGLAFPSPALTEAAKVGILGGSLMAAIAGFAILRLPASPTSADAENMRSTNALSVAQLGQKHETKPQLVP